jgi:hypothetical protein
MLSAQDSHDMQRSLSTSCRQLPACSKPQTPSRPGLLTTEHLTVLFLPAPLLAVTAILAAVLRRRARPLPSPESGRHPSA